MLFLLSLLNVPDTLAVPPWPEPPEVSSTAVERKRPSGAARARANLLRLFSDEDYPNTALQHNEQGTVGVRLTVGRMGLPTRCVVITSSNHASLDEVTCRILMERARFVPARDHRGRAVTDSYNQRVTWAIPTDEPESPVSPPVPLVDWESQATFDVTQGDVGTCTLSDQNTPTPFRIGTCAELAGLAKEAATLGPHRIKGKYRVRLSLRFTTNDRSRTTDLDARLENLSRRTAKLQIDANGILMACDPVGEIDPIKLAFLCNRARSASFDALPANIDKQANRNAVISESTDFVPNP